MLKFGFAVLTGLIGAALLHLVIIFALPDFTGRDAYTRVAALGEVFRFQRVTERPGPSGLATADPFIEVSACAFDIDAGPVRFAASGDVTTWSMAVYDADSNEIFSMNDRTSVTGDLDLVLASPVQMVGLRKALPPALDQSILTEGKITTGYAVLRAFVPEASLKPAALAFLNSATCESLAGR